MNDTELQAIMSAIRTRYAEAYPQWHVVYLAMHKDPTLRIHEYAQLLDMIAADLNHIE